VRPCCEPPVSSSAPRQLWGSLDPAKPTGIIIMPGRDGSTLPIERTEPGLGCVEVLDDGSCAWCLSRSGRAGSAYAAPSATGITEATARSHTRSSESKNFQTRSSHTDSPPTVSSAWRSFVPQVGRPSPPSLRLAGANAPYPNP
jgi:hypothetical protein